jgi:hypothetical protein
MIIMECDTLNSKIIHEFKLNSTKRVRLGRKASPYRRRPAKLEEIIATQNHYFVTTNVDINL